MPQGSFKGRCQREAWQAMSLVLLGNYRKMTLREYLEILDKYDMWCSHLPNDSQLAKMTESNLEKQCLDMEKIFDEAFNEKHIERLNYNSDSKEVL